jgi:hypothetical protein
MKLRLLFTYRPPLGFPYKAPPIAAQALGPVPAQCEILKSARDELSMTDAVDALILDLLEWLADGERSYEEVIGAWRTSCPRLPVWEDANDRALITTEHANGPLIVRITPAGRAFLEARRPSKMEVP